MKFLPLFLLFAFSFSLTAQTDLNTTRTTEALLNHLDEQPDGWHEVLIMLKDRVDVVQMDKDFYARRATLEERTYELITSLKQKAATTQPALLNLLENSNHVDQASIHTFYITNLIFAEMTTDMIVELSQHHAVDYLDINRKTQLVEYECVDEITTNTTPNGTEPGLRAIGAPEFWAMGYTGYGRIGFTSDTGVDPSHPQLLYKYRGIYAPASEAWYEHDNSSNYPEDCDEHGTHVTGTMMGLDRSERDTIGVAYNALWIGQASIVCNDDGTKDNIAGFEWALDPDNNANTIDDMPDAINNSWRDPSSSNTPCDGSPYVSVLNALEATKVAVVFSAGNEGPNPSTMTTPHNINTTILNTFTVGAVNGNSSALPIADFSSRGPSICNTNSADSSIIIKPEVCAPGVSVRSCVPNGYANFQGTSMASPHVAGAIVLLREAFPMTTATEIKAALYFSAIDLGQAGEDNSYGMGIINLPAAFQYLVDEGFTPAEPVSRELDLVMVNVTTNSALCSNNLNFETTIENGGSETISSFNISYSAAGVGDTYFWNGSLAAGERTTVFIEMENVPSGATNLEIELTNPNNLTDPRPLNNRYKAPITVEDIEPLNAFIEGSEVVCESATALVRAEYLGVGVAAVTWHDAAYEGNEIGAGTTLSVGPISEPTTIFAEAKYLIPAGKVNLGEEPQDILPANPNLGLRFDVYADLKLTSIKVYFDEPGYRRIVVKDNDGETVGSVVRNLTSAAGVEDFVMNLDIPAGNNYTISSDLGAPFKLNTDGATFPYLVDGVVNIERSIGVNSVEALKRYHFFYDWQIELTDPCGRVPLNLDLMPDAGTLPTADFTPSTQTLNLTTGDGVVSFSNSSQNAATYSWNFGDGNTSSDSEPTNTYTQIGEYTVSLTTTNAEGCEAHQVATIQVTMPMISGVETILAAEEIQLFPNPTTDNLTIQFDFATPQTLTYQLVDVLGRAVIPLEQGIFGATARTLSLQHLPTGVYYLQIKIDGKQAIRKVMKL